VVDVVWTPSKDGYLKPRVQIEPIQLGGVKIEYATGFNASFIEQNKIGIGALIQIIRSGDVIPHIKNVTVPAEEAKMPNVPYKWNETHIDILLEDIESDETVREKVITGFFRGIEVEGLSSGNIARLIKAGYNTVPKIIHMSTDDFLQVEGFKSKMATKLHEGIKEKLNAASLITIMSASNLFGRGISEKKIEPIMEAYPDILVSHSSQEEKVKKVTDIKGMARKSAEAFVQNIPTFVAFLKDCGLEYKLHPPSTYKKGTQDQVQDQDYIQEKDESHPLYKKSIVITGVRDKSIQEFIKQMGAHLSSSVSKKTVVVITKSKDEDTSKTLEAKKLNIPIYTVEEFKQMYHIA
jgi:NAD-dependent DNA ligase